MMKIKWLFAATILVAAQLSADVFAQTEQFPDERFVTVTFGAVTMQVRLKLAEQLCPEIAPEKLAEAVREEGGVSCVIPHEQYTSHDPNAGLETR